MSARKDATTSSAWEGPRLFDALVDLIADGRLAVGTIERVFPQADVHDPSQGELDELLADADPIVRAEIGACRAS